MPRRRPCFVEHIQQSVPCIITSPAHVIRYCAASFFLPHHHKGKHYQNQVTGISPAHTRQAARMKTTGTNHFGCACLTLPCSLKQEKETWSRGICLYRPLQTPVCGGCCFRLVRLFINVAGSRASRERSFIWQWPGAGQAGWRASEQQESSIQCCRFE